MYIYTFICRVRSEVTMKKIAVAAAILIVCIVCLSGCLAQSGQLEKYTITFDSLGGTSTGSIVTNGNEVIAMPDEPAKIGLVFGGWYTDNTTFSDRFDSQYLLYNPITSDITVYALWLTDVQDPSEVGYTVTYTADADNITGVVPVQDNVFPEDTFTLQDNTFIRPGYRFDCWADGSSKYNVGVEYTAGSRNVIFRAIWLPIEYAIVYRTGGGDNAESNPAKYTAEDSCTLSAATKTGYDFQGWYPTASATGDPVTTIPAGSVGEIELFANWTPTNYDVVYYLDGGENFPDNPATYTIESYEITLADPTKDYYTFDGWYSDAAKTLPSSEIPSGSMGTKIFYAGWAINDYAADFYDGETLLSELSADVTYGGEFSIPDMPDVYPNRIFIGWMYDCEIFVADDVCVMDAAGKNFAAQWVAANYATEGLAFGNLPSGGAQGVMSYGGNDAKVFVPNSYGGRAVEGVGRYAFTAGAQITDIYLPATLNYIAPYAFYGITAKIHFSPYSTISEIGDNAFFGYLGTSIDFPDSVRIIGNDVFANCVNLRQIEMSQNIEEIGDYAFFNCNSLTSIIIYSEALVYIGSNAFDGCANLTELYLYSSPPYLSENVFANCSASLQVYVLDTYIQDYRDADGWKDCNLMAITGG